MAEVLKNKQVNIRQISDNLQNLSTLHPSYSLLSFYYYESPKKSIRKGSEKIISEPFISFRRTIIQLVILIRRTMLRIRILQIIPRKLLSVCFSFGELIPFPSFRLIKSQT